MITSNDLLDLYYSFILIRNNMEYELNPQILEKISTIVLEKCDEDNSIRKGLSMVCSRDSSEWSFVFFNNLYTFRELIKDNKALALISKMCLELKEMIEDKRLEQAYDFVDAIHYIPLMISKGKIRHKDIKKLTKAYSKKWGKYI